MLLTLAAGAIAADLREDHPTTYTVKRGDTLWDIAGRFLKKPWLWPEIWQANPQVENPHLIYPGDVLSLVYIDGKPAVTGPGPQVRSEPAIPTIPLADIEAFLKQTDVVNDVESLPYVVGIEEDRIYSTAGQLAYVRGLSGAQPGDLYEIGRPMAAYTHSRQLGGVKRNRTDELDFRGAVFARDWASFWSDFTSTKGKDFLGYEIMLHSIGEVTRVQGELTVLLLREEGREVRVGDRVLPVEAQPYDPYFTPRAPAATPAGAQVLAVADGMQAGPRVVVALSVGARDGIGNGTVFSIWNQGEVRADVVRHRNKLAAKNDSLRMPDDYVGRVMVFRTFDRVSYALVMEGIRPVHVGDLLKHPDATE